MQCKADAAMLLPRGVSMSVWLHMRACRAIYSKEQPAMGGTPSGMKGPCQLLGQEQGMVHLQISRQHHILRLHTLDL